MLTGWYKQFSYTAPLVHELWQILHQYHAFVMIHVLVCVCVCVHVHSIVSTLCDPMDCSLPASSVHGILEASILEWVIISFSWGSSQMYQSWYIQSSSVAQLCPTLCDPMNRSTPGLPVHHQLPEFTQTHVHQVSDAIQPSHPLLSPSPPALNLSQHQGLFKWVSSSHQVAKILEFQLQHQSFQWTPRTDFL